MKKLFFDNIEYEIIFTKHSKQRMIERGININDLINSIENYDRKYNNYGKKIVEKKILIGNIRTVFSLKEKNIILITSMILGK